MHSVLLSIVGGTSEVLQNIDKRLLCRVATYKVKQTTKLLQCNCNLFIIDNMLDIAESMAVISALNSITMLGKTYDVHPFCYTVVNFDIKNDVPSDIKIELSQYNLSTKEYWAWLEGQTKQ